MPLKPATAFAAMSGAVTLVTTLTGCVWLLTMGRCSDLYTCDGTEVMSVPPRNDPLSAVLAAPIRLGDFRQRLTDAVRKQYASLGNRWPSEADCRSIAAAGCRYTILLRLETPPATCHEKTVLVGSGTDGLPVVNVISARTLHCPDGEAR
jgi:hypothetical protein